MQGIWAGTVVMLGLRREKRVLCERAHIVQSGRARKLIDTTIARRTRIEHG